MLECEDRLVEDVKELIADFYRKGGKLPEYLAENVTWIGEKKKEVYEGAEVVSRHIKNNPRFPLCKMGENSFRVVWKSKYAFLIEGFYVLNPLEKGAFILKNSQRCSVLLERKKENYQIVHIHISDAHENIVWRKDLISQIQRDPLTQIYNVKTVREKVEQWLEEEKAPQGCTMCMIDVDNFKNINDTFGHMKGNDILTRVAHILEKTTGKKGYAGRAGGDEFLIFLKTGEKQAVQEFLEILENTIREECTIVQTKVTVSIGVARSVVYRMDYTKMFGKADQALYLAKKKGKNISYIIDM